MQMLTESTRIGCSTLSLEGKKIANGHSVCITRSTDRTTQIMLPVPKLVVFYNGTTDKDDEVILKLSDAFNENHRVEADIEVRVRMLNVNYGHNAKLMEGCKPLMEYSWFVDRIREYQKENSLEESVKKAIENMPESFRIKSFLAVHMEEIKGMLDTEYNEAEVHEAFKAEGHAEGLAEGRAERDELRNEIERL